MKKINLLIVALAIIPAFGMAQHELDTKANGSIIDNDVAKLWLENFKTRKAGETPGYTYGKETLAEILSASNAAGLRVSYGLDKNQNLKFVLHSVDSKTFDTADDPYDDGAPCPDSCPDGGTIAKIGNKIGRDIAESWKTAYAKANPDQIKSHIFNKLIIEDILKQPEGKGLYFARGLDEGGKERMLLIGVSAQGTLMLEGKVAADSDRVMIALKRVAVK